VCQIHLQGFDLELREDGDSIDVTRLFKRASSSRIPLDDAHMARPSLVCSLDTGAKAHAQLRVRAPEGWIGRFVLPQNHLARGER